VPVLQVTRRASCQVVKPPKTQHQTNGDGLEKRARKTDDDVQGKGPMEVVRLLSRLPASTVRLRLRVTLTFGVFLVGSHQGALGITKRARQSKGAPFDGRIIVVCVLLGRVDAVRTAQSRMIQRSMVTNRELAQPAKRRPCASCVRETVQSTPTRRMDPVVAHSSHQLCRHPDSQPSSTIPQRFDGSSQHDRVTSLETTNHGMLTSTNQTPRRTAQLLPSGSRDRWP
jgi:hypothetical protein